LGKEKRPFFVKPDAYRFLLGLMGLCSMLAEGAMFDWSVNYFENVIKAEKSFRTAGYLSFVITMALGRLVGDGLVHRFGVYSMLMINGAMMASGFLLMATFPYVLPAAFGCLLIGAGDSILVPVVYLLAAKSKKMTPNYAISSVTLIGYTGFLIGPLLIGNVSQRVGMGVAFYILSAFSLLIVFLTIRVKNMR
jgi:fucose permease